MIEQGIDIYGAEYKRTSNDFNFRWLEQDNCVCSICHGTGAKIEFRYITRNYESPITKKICKNLQAHGHSFWICPICLYRLDSKSNGIKEKVKRIFRNGIASDIINDVMQAENIPYEGTDDR